MHILIRTVLLLGLGVGMNIPAAGQLFNLNPPTITGQRPTPLITEKNTSITIGFQNLRVSDPDIFVPQYPQGYTLKVAAGNNYTLSDATVTPSADFVGTLSVPVQVNDGKFDSNIFNVSINVTNIKPDITGHDPISFKEGTSFTILLSHLTVDDGDNQYPDDFTLTVYDGDNYSINGNTIRPDGRFSGTLRVAVSVNDGHVESDQYEMTIDVKANIVPVIRGHVSLSTNQRSPITLRLAHLVVQDADNTYPKDFTLKVFEGNNYTLKDSTVTPNANFTGTLRVPVTVHDGLDESKKFEVRIDVIPKINKPPEITGQEALITNEDQSITVSLSNLKVSDDDNNYPAGFVLKIPQGTGANYSAAGNIITPARNYNGQLSIQITVNDGLDDSQPFPLSIVVTPVNDAPVITGQEVITIPSGKPTALHVTSLRISDADNENPSGFTLRILPGTNYSASGNVITTAANVIGELNVRVVVNDGGVDSAPYTLKVGVVEGGTAPLITGQQFLVTNEDTPIQINLTNLFVTDDNNGYPKGFTLTVHPGTDYSFQEQTVTPGLDKNGMLVVNVTVNDGKESSPSFPLKIYVLPVNDAPHIETLEETAILYEPGSPPLNITNEFTGRDVDSPYLGFAEVGFDSTFSPLHDELIFQNTEQIRGIYDPSKGILSLIGYASIGKYDSAIRSIKYNYLLTVDEDGNQSEVKPGKKRINFTLSDGQLVSASGTRTVMIESSAELDIPNTFTPNGDQVNDTWRVKPVVNASRFDKALVKVYSKKGLLLYEAKGFERSWDGSFNGEILPTDTYYYTIDLMLSYTKRTYKGTVTILR